jgi:hypothetical protein
MVPATFLYVNTLREGEAAHVVDPFDPVEVARRRVDHAVEWHHRDLDRLAVTELAGVVDLARATGLVLEPEDVIRLDSLRAAALSTWPLDPREVEWAMGHATELIDRLAPTADDDADDGPGDGPDDSDATAAGATDGQGASAGSTDSAVTVHCEERLPIVSTRFDQSSSER